MDLLKEMERDPILKQSFYDWRLRLGGIESESSSQEHSQEIIGGYTFAERQAFRSAVEKMLD